MKIYPGIQIAGMYSPPFRPMTEEEDKAIVERINEVNQTSYGLALVLRNRKNGWQNIRGKLMD